MRSESVRSAAEGCAHPWPFVEELLRLRMAAVGPRGALRLPEEAEALRTGGQALLRAERHGGERAFTLEPLVGPLPPGANPGRQALFAKEPHPEGGADFFAFSRNGHGPATSVIRTALCVEPRGGRLHLFMPPVALLEEYLEPFAPLHAATDEQKAALEEQYSQAAKSAPPAEPASPPQG